MPGFITLVLLGHDAGCNSCILWLALSYGSCSKAWDLSQVIRGQ